MKRLPFILLLFAISTHAFSQKTESPYTREITAGLNFNSYGGVLGGFSLKYSKKREEQNNLTIFSLDVVEIKHMKEQRTTSFKTGQIFVFAKENHLFSIRPLIGKEFILFNKYPQEGVRLSAHISGGPAIGLLKPYYVEYDFAAPGDSVSDIEVVPFDTEVTKNPNQVLSGGFFFRGFSQIEVAMGLHLRAGVNFEFGRKRQYEKVEVLQPQSVSGLEIGFTYERYPRVMPILGFAENFQTYSAIYLNMYFGKRW